MSQQITVWKYPTSTLVLFIAGFLLLLLAFWGGLGHLVGRWDKQEEYSHGYLIPLVTGYLIWQRWDLLKTLEFKPSWAPVALVLSTL
jgi:hypothetical protein